MNKSYFITGTDTNIGKTMAACALIQAGVRAGYLTSGYKPVSSGGENTVSGLKNRDAMALLESSNVALPYHKVNPFAFIDHTSPHIASREEGRIIELHTLSSGLRALETQAELLFIEGAGGWFTPISDTRYYSDWVSEEHLAVIMVVGIKLGCINHALLTALAVKQAGLQFVGWIANHSYPHPHRQRQKEYIDELIPRLDAPLIGTIPWLNDAYRAPLADYIDLSILTRYRGRRIKSAQLS